MDVKPFSFIVFGSLISKTHAVNLYMSKSADNDLILMPKVFPEWLNGSFPLSKVSWTNMLKIAWHGKIKLNLLENSKIMWIQFTFKYLSK